jgi:hypothetical protein
LALVLILRDIENWAPGVAARVARHVAGLELGVGSVRVYPLGRLVLRNVELRVPGSEEAALELAEASVDYARVVDLLGGRATVVHLRGLRIYEAEALRMRDSARGRSSGDGPTPAKPDRTPPSVRDLLVRWAPRSVVLDDVALVRPNGRSYVLASLQLERGDLLDEEIRCRVQLETASLDSMIPRAPAHPFKLDVSIGVSSQSLRLLSWESGVGPLLRTRAGEMSRPLNPRSNVVEFEDTALDIDQALESLGLRPPGELRGSLELKRLQLGQEESDGAATGGLAPGAIVAQTDWRLDLPHWRGIAPNFGLGGAEAEWRVGFAGSPDFSAAWARHEGKWSLDRLQTPRGPHNDIRLGNDIQVWWRDEALEWKSAFSLAGPDASAQKPVHRRLGLEALFDGRATLDPFVLDSRFILSPRVESRDSPTFESELRGRLRHAPGRPYSLDLATSGSLIGGEWALGVSATPEDPPWALPARAELTARNASIERGLAFLDILGLDMPLKVEGVASLLARAELPSSNSIELGGELAASGLRIFLKDAESLFKKPLPLDLKLRARGPLDPRQPIEILQADLAVDQLLRVQSSGVLHWRPDGFGVRSRQDWSLSGVHALRDYLPWEIPLVEDAALHLVGRTDYHTDFRKHALRFEGRVELDNARLSLPMESGPGAKWERSLRLGGAVMEGSFQLDTQPDSVETLYRGLIRMSDFDARARLASEDGGLAAARDEDSAERHSHQFEKGRIRGLARVARGSNGAREELDVALGLERSEHFAPWVRWEVDQTSATARFLRPDPDSAPLDPASLRAAVAFEPFPLRFQLLRSDGGLTTSCAAVFEMARTFQMGGGRFAEEAQITRFEAPGLIRFVKRGGSSGKTGPGGTNLERLRREFTIEIEDLSALLAQLGESRLLAPVFQADPKTGAKPPFQSLGQIVDSSTGTLALRDAEIDYSPESLALSADLSSSLSRVLLLRDLFSVLLIDVDADLRARGARLDPRVRPLIPVLPDQDCGRLRIGRVMLGGVSVEGIEGDLLARGGKILSEETRFILYDGEGKMSWEAEMKPDGPVVSFRGLVRGVDLERFTQEFKSDMRMEGVVNILVRGLYTGKPDSYAQFDVIQQSPIVLIDRETFMKYLDFLVQVPALSSMLRPAYEKLARLYSQGEYVALSHFLVRGRHSLADNILRLRIEFKTTGFDMANNVNIEDLSGLLLYFQQQQTKALGTLE